MKPVGMDDVVRGLVAFGLGEADAWRLVRMQQGEDTVVLLQAGADGGGDPLWMLHPEQAGAAAANGVAWRSPAPGQWQYVRRLDGQPQALLALRDELVRLLGVLEMLRSAEAAAACRRGQG